MDFGGRNQTSNLISGLTLHSSYQNWPVATIGLEGPLLIFSQKSGKIFHPKNYFRMEIGPIPFPSIQKSPEAWAHPLFTKLAAKIARNVQFQATKAVAFYMLRKSPVLGGYPPVTASGQWSREATPDFSAGKLGKLAHVHHFSSTGGLYIEGARLGKKKEK